MHTLFFGTFFYSISQQEHGFSLLAAKDKTVSEINKTDDANSWFKQKSGPTKYN